MRTTFFSLLSLVAHLRYAACLPSSHLEVVAASHNVAEADTCVPISPVVDSIESLLAKTRALLGVCPSEDLYHAQSTALQRRQAGGTVEDYSCDENRPCKNGACCAKTGFCGYGPDSCGDGTSPNDHCWSQCDAKAECGRYAKTPGQECPLKVCCSQFGFCGTTDQFCAKTNDANTTCQSNCDQPGSGSSGGDVQSRIIGYYEAWNWQKNCIGMQLKDIPVSSITHLHYSFAYVAPGSYAITTMDDTVPTELFAQFAGLKKQNPALKVIVSIGGWTFNDNGTITQPVFGDIASSSGNRAKFIDSLLSFMTNYGFDGVDFDWEYPGAGDRGGHDNDGVNYTQLISDLRARFSGVISFTAPTSYWYLRHFDLFAMTKHVDWINVMSYDLHGTWDSSNPIGNHVLAHTNLTEVKLALDLYWRNSIPANKLNLGLGFYGRSFQLSDPECSTPGCLFKGGASPGPCTQNSGTLSYREIMDVISTHGLTPYYDKTNQVKYVTWGGDQWVSYDDQETFQAKIKLANEMGLGGVLIWSLDQDTAQLDALAGVIYPKSLGAIGAAAESANNWEQAGGGDCRVTDCGTTGCRTGEVFMSTQQCDGKGHESSICCPFSSAPDAKACSWRGGYPYCNGQCHPGEVALASSFWGDGKKCKDGRKFYCCPATRELPACRWTECGESCGSDENKLTWAEESCWDDEQSFCCKKTQDWQNCQWYGKGGSCFDDHCPTGHSVSLSTSYEGEGTDCGIHFERQRSFCCDPPVGQSPFSPVPLEYLFPSPPTGPGVDSKFDLKLDPTYGGSSPLKFGDDPNDAEFGFVVLASPETIQVSLNARDGSHWEVFDCFDDKSEEAQTVRMMCTDHTETSTCDKIHLGHGAPGTIVEMPKGCGPGKYAVVKEMRESRNQGLPKHLVKRGLLQSKIFDLTFDYDFSRVPRDMGNTQMRIDYSNEPGYWDKIVNKTATKRKRSLDTLNGNHRRWLEDAWREDLADHRRGVLPYDELHKRWFGSDIISWLKGLINGVTDVPIISNGYTDDFTVILLNEVVQGCPIGPAGTTVSGKLDVRASTHVELHTSFGFTLITTLSNSGSVSFKDSYLYFNNRGKVSAKFTADVVATAQFDSGDKTLVSADQFGAAFAVPGIVTIGPNFKLVGQVKGQLTLGAYFEANVNLADWDIRQTYPDQGPDWDPKAPQTPNRDGTQELLTPEWMYGVSASGFVELHVKPTVTFGIDFNKNFINTDGASVNLVADGWIRFHADANHGGGSSNPSSSTFCYGVDAGADLYASIKAPSFNGWTLAKSPLPIASSDPIQIIPTTCPITSRDLHELSGFNESMYRRHGIASSSSSADLLSIRNDHRALNGLEKRAQTYGPIIRLGIQCPVGNNGGGTSPGPCPLCDTAAVSRRATAATGDSCVLVLGRSDESTCESNILDARDLDALGVEWGAENISQIDHQLWKRGSKTGTWLLDPGNPASAQTISFNSYPECNKLNTNGITKWFGFDEQGMSTPNCPTDVSKFTSAQVDSSTYQTDHIFEAQTVLHFLDFLRGGGQFNLPIRLPSGYTAATSAWVNDVLLNAGTGSFNVQNLNGHSLLELITNNVLGDSTAAGRGRMALLYKGINNDKGHFFKFENLGTLDVTGKVRASKIIQRNTAGVFGYMRKQEIAPKFQASGQAFENALAQFDAAYAWGSHVGAEPGRPAGANRGLRDLWAYWVDVYLATIEARAGTWAGQARTAMQGLSSSATDEAANWVTSFFGPGGAGNVLQFAQPNPGSQVGPSGVAVPNSRYGMWTTASGPWT